VKKIIGVLLAGLLLIAGGCSSGGSERQGAGEELIISIGQHMADGNYDPVQGYGMYEPDIFHNGLLKVDADLQLQPDLAEKYEVSADGLVYTYYLRKDIKFNDGQRLTAKDVVFTYERAKESGSAVDLTALAEIAAPDDYVIVIRLNKPFSPFAASSALLGIVPAHAYGENYGDYPIGTGAWKVAQLDRRQQVILVPNEHYFGEKPSFKKVTILALEEEAAFASAKSGKLDLVMVNPEYSKEKISGMELKAIKTTDNRGLQLPVMPARTVDGKVVGNDVTADIAIRQALNIGIDRKKIIENAFNGIGTPAYGRISYLPWQNSEPLATDNRVEEAKKILEDAGWIDRDGDGIREKNGIRAEFKITGRTDDLQRYNLAVAVAEDAKKLGINMIPVSASWAECKEWTPSIPTVWASGSYSPVDLYLCYHSSLIGKGTNNQAGYSNAKVDEYLEKALSATSSEEATDYWKLAQWDGSVGANGDYPWLWIVNMEHTYFVGDRLDIGKQRPHPHGHGVPVIQNLNEWQWK